MLRNRSTLFLRTAVLGFATLILGLCLVALPVGIASDEIGMYRWILIAALFAAGLPYIYYVADKDDAPGVVAIALVIVGASLAVAVFAGVLQRLLQNAIDIKAENDLTV